MIKYLLIVVMGLVGCGSEEKDEPAKEEVEPDLTPVRTFETTPPDKDPEPSVVTYPPEPKKEVVEPEPEKTEPVSKPTGPSKFEIEDSKKKQRTYVMGLMATLRLGDTFLTMIPELKTMLLNEGGCNGSNYGESISCTLLDYKGCIGPNGGQYEATCADENDDKFYYRYWIVFNGDNEVIKIVSSGTLVGPSKTLGVPY